MPKFEMENGKKRYWACKAIVLNNGRILLLRNNPAGFELGHKPELGDWEVPGGRMEAGESDEQTLKREVKEEIGLEPEVGRFVTDFEFSPRDDVVIRGKCYLCSVPSRNVVLENSGRRHDLAVWLTVDEALKKTMPAWLREAIVKIRHFEEAKG